MVRRGVLAFFLSSSSVLNSRAIAIILYTLLYQLSKLPKPPFLFADVVVAFAFLRRRSSSSSSSISSEFINFVAFTFAVYPVTNRPMPDPTILGPIFFFFSSSSSIFFSVFVLTAIVALAVLISATPPRLSSYSFSNFVHGF